MPDRHSRACKAAGSCHSHAGSSVLTTGTGPNPHLGSDAIVGVPEAPVRHGLAGQGSVCPRTPIINSSCGLPACIFSLCWLSVAGQLYKRAREEEIML